MVVPVAGGRNLQTLPCHWNVAGFFIASSASIEKSHRRSEAGEVNRCN
jgi:hypothetical protein